MIVHRNGSYEQADWHTEEFVTVNYPESYWVDESKPDGALLVEKMLGLKYFNLITVDGHLLDVEEREPTREEVETSKPKKTEQQLKIEQLEAEKADLQSRVADVELMLADIISGGM